MSGAFDGVVLPFLRRASERVPSPTGDAGLDGLGELGPVANETESGRAGSRVVDLPLSSFELEGHPLEVRVPWLPVTLWFVPAERDVRVLMTHGVSRGRIWTGKELADLLALSDRTPQVVWTLAQVKLAVDGDIVETRSRRNGDGGQGAQSA